MTVIIGGSGTANGISYFSSPTTFGGTLATASRGISNASIPAGGVLQVQQAVKLDAFTSTSGYSSFVDITGLSVNITPTLTSSKILITGHVHLSGDSWSGGDVLLNIVRNSTNICVSTGGSTYNSTLRFLDYAGAAGDTRYTGAPASFSYLDSPSTTSSTTYKIQGCILASGYTWAVNRRMDNATLGATSSITVMEIAQ